MELIEKLTEVMQVYDIKAMPDEFKDEWRPDAHPGDTYYLAKPKEYNGHFHSDIGICDFTPKKLIDICWDLINNYKDPN